MQDVSGMFHKREIGVRNDTYTRAEIDAKDGAIQAAADKAQEAADGAVEKNSTQDTQIAALQKSAHSHSNKDVLDKTEQPYTTAERDKLAGLENYTHPTHTAYSRGLYNITVDSEGHIISATTVTASDITKLGIPSADDTPFSWGKSKRSVGTAIYGDGYVFIKEFPIPNYLNSRSIFSEERKEMECTYSHSIISREPHFENGGYNCYIFNSVIIDEHCKISYLPESKERTVSSSVIAGTANELFQKPGSAKTNIIINSCLIAGHSNKISANNACIIGFDNISVSNFGVFTGGTFCVGNENVLIELGNGTSDDNRSDAFYVTTDGDVFCYGDTTSLNAQIDANTAARHTHSNKSILDQLNEEQWKIINGAANKAHVHDNKETLDKITDALWNTVYSNTHTHDNKSVLDGTTANYTTEEKTKLAGIAGGANKYTHPTTSGNKHIPSGGSSGQILRWSADGTAVWGADNNTTYSDATQTAHGLMSAEDKISLDSMSLLHLNVGGSTNFVGVKFKANRVSARFMVMENNGERADIYISLRIGIDTKAKVYVSGNTNSEYKVFYDNLNYVYVIFNCQLWSYIVCTSTVRIENMIEWRGTSYPTGLTGVSMDIQILLDTGNYKNYALAKDGTAVAAAKLSTARKINTVEYDGTKDITIPRSGMVCHEAGGTGGQQGYVKIATIKITAQYTNMPTIIYYRNRGAFPVKLVIMFSNSDTTDPGLYVLEQTVELANYNWKRAYMNKTAAGTWDLIIAKSEAWDSVQILDCQPASHISVTFVNVHISTLPSTAIASTVYERAMVTSTVAAANTLTDSGWVAVSNFSVNTSSFSQITTSFRKYGDIIFIRGRVQPKSNMTSISLCSTTSTSLTGITPSHSVRGVGISSDGLAPFSVNVTTSPANSVILKGNFLADKIYDFEFSYMK